MTKNYTIKDERKNVCSINEKVAGYMYAFSAKYNIKKKSENENAYYTKQFARSKIQQLQ